MERREDLPPGAFRGNPRNLGDDEILGPEALLGNDPFLNLADFSAGELRFRPEQNGADPRLPLAASDRHADEIVARPVDAPIPVGQPKLVDGQPHTPGHPPADQGPAPSPAPT